MRDYLLSLHHDAGRSKAKFFLAAGFSAYDWRALASALRGHATQGRLTKVEDTPYGRKYIVDGPLQCPDGKPRRIRSIWFINRGESEPRLVTAYPIG